MSRSPRWEEFLAERLDRLDRSALRRRLVTLGGPQGRHVDRPEGPVLNFSSNDYLGLAKHPQVVEAAHTELSRSGGGAGASRLISGTFEAHEALEKMVADLKGAEAAVVFSSGYAAAMGAIPALCGRGDVILLDKLCHACLVDAARLSGAVIRVFPHNDLQALEKRLEWARTSHPSARVLIIVESVYSMDGDVCPLREIVEMKQTYGAWLFLDEAHALGVVGPRGMGLAAECGLSDSVEVQMGTFGKAAGAHGAAIAGHSLLRELMVNAARSLVFSTAPPPHVAAAARAGLELLASPEGDRLRMILGNRISTLCSLTGLPSQPAAIVPVVVGCERMALASAETLLAKGLWVPAIRYPSVARGASRLRITLTAAHEPEDIERLAAALSSLDGAMGRG